FDCRDCGPIRNCREASGCGRRTLRCPEFRHDRLPCRQPFKAVDRNWKERRSDVLAEREQTMVAAQIRVRVLIAFVRLYLQKCRIALDQNDPLAGEEIVVQLLTS